MISIIVCSINPQLAEQFKSNVSETIGVEHEFIIWDNRGDNSMGITAVYNRCAERAKYDMLCFAHEDVLFRTCRWGEKIVAQLMRDGCGVIGFAGSTVKSRNYSGWGQWHKYNRCNYIQHYGDGRIERCSNVNLAVPFERVVTLDGLALFVNKSVWSENRFDENLLKSFHCYDIDFALQVNSNYNNYICNCVDIEHLSAGSYNEAWLNATMLLHDVKWGAKLPISIDDMSAAKHKRNERAVEYMFVKRLVQSDPSRDRCRAAVWSYVKKYWMLNGSVDIIAKHIAR